MGKKVFISYSHKDESHKEDLEDHLSALRRNGIISVWNDRMITPGDEWKSKIDDNLNEAEIILLLISPSFLASDYCYDVELKRAIEKHEEGSSKIIAVIVRACDWTDCHFSRYQAVPKDAKPIALWEDKDSAWLDAINGIKKIIHSFTPERNVKTANPLKSEVTVSPIQEKWLEDTEIALTHRKADKVKLHDIYVYPDIEFEPEPKKNIEIKIVESSTLTKKPGRYLILGEDQQGKTSLLKRIFSDSALSGRLPIYIDAESITKTDLDKILERQSENQYINLNLTKLKENKNKILLLDNLDRIGLNQKHRNIFMESINNEFEFVIATCNSSFNYISSEIPALSEYKAADLLGLGNLKREEIIRKWISLGVEESIDESTLYSNCDELKNQLNIVIKKNIVPPKPIYVLMMLQMFEAYAQQNIELTSYGHCYQQLIYQSLEKANINGKDYGKYLNVLTEMSWQIFKINDGLNKDQLEKFFNNYEDLYLSVDRSEITEKLIANSILMDRQQKINFKYPYIYYFFVGKKIAEGFSENPEVREKVDILLENLHREDFANILIFITHHTKESWILNKMQSILASLFSDNEKATLTRDQLSFMDEFMKAIPELVIEQREIQQERDNQNRALDEYERKDSDDEPLESIDIFATINKTFKGMEIAGQIIRNRHATMTRRALYELADSGTSTGLRFLDYFIKISDASKNEIIKFISQILSDHPNLTNKQVQDHAESAYLHLTYGVINGVIKKVSSSIGSKEAHEVYKALEESAGTPAYALINQAVELQFKRIVNISSIEKTKEKIKSSPVCLRILREMIVQHIYMFPVEYREKQQLSELLGISIQGQRFMDQKRIGKG